MLKVDPMAIRAINISSTLEAITDNLKNSFNQYKNFNNLIK
jgi:hypothetical protein